MSGALLGVAVIGCGLIGRRRAQTAARHPGSRLRVVVDAEATRAEEVARAHGCDVAPDWRAALERSDVTAVVVSTPNHLLAEIGCTALASGRHVLLEKPMGRNHEEAVGIAAAAARARERGRVLKVGFNHRYHPGIEGAHDLIASGELGRLINLRARYGHGSRPGCEAEWRADAERAGGGELTDQGVHIADLFHWLAGVPETAFGVLQTAFWRIQPLEDNAFGLFRFPGGTVGQLHTSMTQWKNLFSLEVHAERGAVVVEGLGGSYGPERLTVIRRRPEGGVPETAVREFPAEDGSWAAEWADFVTATSSGEVARGSAEDGLAAMRMIDALYRSARLGMPVPV